MTTHKEVGHDSATCRAPEKTTPLNHGIPHGRARRPTRKEVAKAHHHWSELYGRKTEDSYSAEVKRSKPVAAFRRAGAKLLPLQIVAADAQDFGKHYFVRAVNGVQLFGSEDEFSATLVRDVLTLVIKGSAR